MSGVILLLILSLYLKTAYSSTSIENDPQWQALIHYKKESSRSVLNQTLEELQKDKDAHCLYPARSLWLQNQNLVKALDFTKCSDLQDFISRAPADDIAVIFASENITQPSSMMGHIFLKLSGRRSEKRLVEHAISFFTDVENTNPLSLAWETIVVGKRGHYALTPYTRLKDNYIFNEQRSIWEYSLKLTPFQQKLLTYHLYELKNVEFTYYFHAYNCSTLIKDILNVAFPNQLQINDWWVTPLDVIRKVDKEEFIASKQVIASSKWKIRALQTSLTKEQSLYNLEYEVALNDFAYESEKIDQSTWKNKRGKLKDTINNNYPKQVLDVSSFKQPSKTPQDSQLQLSYLGDKHKDYIIIGYMPASHELVDDNSQYTSESELKIFSPSLEWDTNRKKVRLHDFTLYSLTSLGPSDTALKTLSGSVNLSYGTHRNLNLDLQKGIQVEGLIGKTKRLWRDIDAFLLIGGGYKSVFDGAYTKLRTGLLIREIGNMKTILNYAPSWKIPFKKGVYHQLSATQHFSLTKNFAVDIEFQKNIIKDTSLNQVELKFKLHF